MKRVITILVIVLSGNLAFGQWYEKPTPGIPFNLFAFSFPTANTGFAVGYGGRMIKSTNGGESWSNISIFPTTAQDLNAVWFLNENTGWMGASNDTLYYTTNSGLTWINRTSYGSDINKIYFVNSTTGWMLCHPRLYRTTNSGANWNLIYSQMDYYFTFVNSEIGWMTTYNSGSSTIHKTTDGGSTWTAQYSTSDFRVIYCLDFVNENTGWVAGYREVVLKTTNGGATWVQQRDMNNSTGFFSMDFLNENTGWIIGDPGQSIYTIDGGSSWNQITLNAGRGNVKFLNQNTGWVIGSKVFKTTNGGFTYRNLNNTALIEGLYNQTTNSTITDSVKIYLRKNFSPYELVDSAMSVMNSNGLASFSLLSAQNSVNYYMVLKHRNSVETWSSQPHSFLSNNLSYDFTTAASQAFGNNMKQVDNTPMRYAIYSGDVNQDGVVDASDNSDIDNDAFNFATGYVKTDITGDEIVDASDAAIAGNNAFNFVAKITP